MRFTLEQWFSFFLQVLIFTTPVASPKTPAGVAQTNSLSPSPAVPSKPENQVTSAGVTPTPAATSTSGVKTDSTNPAAQTVTAPSPSNAPTSQPQKMVTLTSGQVIKPVSPSVAVAPKAGEAKSVNQVEPKKDVKEEPSSDQSISSTPPQVTAQFVQTPQGLRIIVRGIQGASIPKHQLNKLVRAELLEVQAEAKRLCQVPPTKITINLPPSLLQYKQLKASLAKMVQVHQERLRKDILTKWALLRENESMLIQHKVKETLWDLHIQHGQERDRGAHQVRRGQRKRAHSKPAQPSRRKVSKRAGDSGATSTKPAGRASPRAVAKSASPTSNKVPEPQVGSLATTFFPFFLVA